MENEILDRIKQVMDGNKLNNNSFSKKIGVTASTINSMFEKQTKKQSISELLFTG